MHKSSVLSPAKINLGLASRARLPNGYHDVDNLLTTLPFYDQLLITDVSSNFTLTCSDSAVPVDEHNLLFSVYQKMSTLLPAPRGISIHLTKNIPLESGLGGGSLNAATLIKYLHEHWQLHLSVSELIELAKSIGSDIAFSLIANCAYETKHGLPSQGKITALPALPACSVLLIDPALTISCADSYHLLDKHLTSDDYDFAPLISALQSRDLSFAHHLHNSFETSLFIKYPLLANLKQFLLNHGALGALMTGKGCFIYGIFADAIQAKKTDTAMISAFTNYQTWIFNYA